jgi:hypothetical protein
MSDLVQSAWKCRIIRIAYIEGAIVKPDISFRGCTAVRQTWADDELEASKTECPE